MSLYDNLRNDPPKPWTPRPQLLLSDPLPVAMHGMAPRVVLGQEWWDTVRFAAYRSTVYHCIACEVLRGSTKWCQWLEGHEVYDIDYLLGRMVYVETVPLCHRCHKYIHSGYLNIQREQGIITKSEYDAVVKHGRATLRRAKLSPHVPYKGPVAEWNDWRLVIGDREYAPLHKSFEEYQKHYAGK